MSDMTKHRIICPKCSTVQTAFVLNTKPFPILVHECDYCKYVIMESEWEKVKEPANQYDPEQVGLFDATMKASGWEPILDRFGQIATWQHKRTAKVVTNRIAFDYFWITWQTPQEDRG